MLLQLMAATETFTTNQPRVTIMGESAVLVAGIAFVLCVLIAWMFGGKSREEPADPQAEFKAAKMVMDRPRYDAETGEWYAYKITRVPAQAPQERREPTIVEPIQRRARS